MTPAHDPEPPARKSVSHKMKAVMTSGKNPARMRAGTICAFAFAASVLLLVFIPHPPGEKHETMEIVAVMSLGIGMLALLAPETIEGIGNLIKSVGEMLAKLRPGRKP